MVRKRILYGALAILLFAAVCFPTYAAADEIRTLRVGYMDYHGFIERESDGSYTGYGAEYLNRISDYTGFQYEYVYEEWSELLEQLAHGEDIDLLCTAQYTDERAESFEYSAYPIGYTQGLLYTSRNNDALCYEDFVAFDGMTVGALRGSAMTPLFRQYAVLNGFSCIIQEYNTEEELLEALKDNRIDAMCSEHLANHTELSLLANFGADAYYMISYKGKMFEPFAQEDTTTSRYGGSGLGLSISKSLVDAMGGTITAESIVGIGTSFVVRIPLEKTQRTLLLKSTAAENMAEETLESLLKGKRILMAEDHPLNIMVAKKLLEQKGVIVTVAENGLIAVNDFRNSAPYEYDLILMDIRMPIMDGLEATRLIRALDRPDAKKVPIIAMTANAMEEDRGRTRAAGMNEHLAKPIDPKQMYQTLAKQIAGKKI